MTPMLEQIRRRRRSCWCPDKNQEETGSMTKQGDRSMEHQQMHKCSFRTADDCCLIRDETLFVCFSRLGKSKVIDMFLGSSSPMYKIHTCLFGWPSSLYKFHTCLLVSVGWPSSVRAKFTHIYTKSACFSKTQKVRFFHQDQFLVMILVSSTKVTKKLIFYYRVQKNCLDRINLHFALNL